MKGCLSVILLFALVVIAAYVIGSGSSSHHDDWRSDSPSTHASDFTQKGFFKDGVGNRVYTYEISGSSTAAQVQAHANNLVYTAGHPAAAYYYAAGSRMPIDGVTLAKNFFAASAAIDTPGRARPAYIFVRAINGNTSFTDCLSDPRADMCQPTN